MKLYALLDEESMIRYGWSLERFVRRASALGAEIIQYRNKSGDMELAASRLEELVSTHNETEISEANTLEIDYIGLGACRSTGTKSDANVLGIERVSALASLSTHPVAAIGGVRLDDAIPNITYHVIGSGLYED